jgi:hypothetical protein
MSVTDLSKALRVFSRVLDEALAGLARPGTTHGALLALGELFGFEAAAGDAGVRAMLAAKFPLCCEAVLKVFLLLLAVDAVLIFSSKSCALPRTGA